LGGGAPRTIRPLIRQSIEHFSQPRQHPIQIAHHILIGESQRPVSEAGYHVRIAGEVYAAIMRYPVDLHDHPLGGAEEIRDPPADHGLAAELVACKAAGTKGLPQAGFRRGGIVAEMSGAPAHRMVPEATTPNPLL